MIEDNTHTSNTLYPLEKVPSGIVGLDEITGGGLPKGRPTLVAGSAGSGKTLLGVEFLVHGAMEYNDPGVFVAFEETPQEISRNVASLGYNLPDLVHRKLLALDHVYIERREIEETGEYDLEGLFVRLGYLVDGIQAKRIVLDTLEALFAGFQSEGILRGELRRLFRWLKEKELTAVITAEQGKGTVTRHGLEEYVSDAVIILDHRVIDQVATRRLRVMKYRGSVHGTNEYPFLIDEQGFSILPITSLGLNHAVSEERVSTGIERLDVMLGGKGYYRGSSILVSGTAGAGKSTLAAYFAGATCRRGEICLYLAFEESVSQIIRNMKSIGLDLEPSVRQELLKFHAVRPTYAGLEVHLAQIHKLIDQVQPSAVVVDPVSNLIRIGNLQEVLSMMTRLIDFLKNRGITTLFTNLASRQTDLEETVIGISSVMDAWIVLSYLQSQGERARGIQVLKARGVGHSNQIREFVLSDQGIDLVDVYTGTGAVLTGSARLAQETQERSAALLRRQTIERKRRELELRRRLLESRIETLKNEFESEEEDFRLMMSQEQAVEHASGIERKAMSRKRRADEKGVE
jgi:circadian clock protein KaiC